jgi:hypothetical protein
VLPPIGQSDSQQPLVHVLGRPVTYSAGAAHLTIRANSNERRAALGTHGGEPGFVALPTSESSSPAASASAWVRASRLAQVPSLLQRVSRS